MKKKLVVFVILAAVIVGLIGLGTANAATARKFPTKPGKDPGPRVPPKRSPMRLPMAEPHAPAGPKRRLNTMGKMFATRTSVMPGIRGMVVLNAMRAAP